MDLVMDRHLHRGAPVGHRPPLSLAAAVPQSVRLRGIARVAAGL